MPDHLGPIIADASAGTETTIHFPSSRIGGGQDELIIHLSGVNQGDRHLYITPPDSNFIAASVPQASAVAMTTNTWAVIQSMPLPAGEWDVMGLCAWDLAATTSITALAGGHGTVNTFLNAGDRVDYSVPAQVPNGVIALAMMRWRYILAVTTTIYHLQFAQFTVSTCKGFGRLTATRPLRVST